MARVYERFMERRAVSSVGRASRLHRRNSHETRRNMSTFCGTERDSMANNPASADHIRTTSEEALRRALAMLAPTPTPTEQLCQKDEGLVYFLQAGPGGAIKIGTTQNLPRRLKKLQQGQPAKLIVCATRKGGRLTERNYHNRFKAAQIRGEWFTPHPDILAEITRLTTGGARG